MVTEKEISKQMGRTIKSPIRVANLEALGMDKAAFLAYYQPLFETLEDDLYLIRQKQMVFLETVFEDDFDEINVLHKDYFEGTNDGKHLEQWIEQLNPTQKAAYDALSIVTRQRNISSFLVTFEAENARVERVVQDDFQQDVEDFRVWKRVFAQATPEAVEHDLFYNLLIKVGEIVRSIHPEVKQLKFTSHFMRTIAQENIPGENAPEGIHEDGAQYIVSALVINRQNVVGGETRIFEKPASNNQTLIYKTVLQPGEFVFQADTGEELTFGNDLWHNVTAIHPVDTTKLGIRDIIGFDIDLVG